MRVGFHRNRDGVATSPEKIRFFRRPLMSSRLLEEACSSIDALAAGGYEIGRFSPRKKQIDYLTFEALKAWRINDTGYFVGIEHAIHRRFEEFESDVPVIFRQIKFRQNLSARSG
jgi:hypothetical protein